MKTALCKISWIVFFLGFLANGHASSSFGGCEEIKTLGEVPSPFSMSAIRVELADGETYPLIGALKYDKSGAVHFEIDFFEQPWLASRSRMGNPSYLVQSNRYLVSAKDSDMSRVRILMKAERVMMESGKTEIRLTPIDFPIAEPVIKSKRAKMYCDKLESTK